MGGGGGEGVVSSRRSDTAASRAAMTPVMCWSTTKHGVKAHEKESSQGPPDGLHKGIVRMKKVPLDGFTSVLLRLFLSQTGWQTHVALAFPLRARAPRSLLLLELALPVFSARFVSAV